MSLHCGTAALTATITNMAKMARVRKIRLMSVEFDQRLFLFFCYLDFDVSLSIKTDTRCDRCELQRSTTYSTASGTEERKDDEEGS